MDGVTVCQSYAGTRLPRHCGIAPLQRVNATGTGRRAWTRARGRRCRCERSQFWYQKTFMRLQARSRPHPRQSTICNTLDPISAAGERRPATAITEQIRGRGIREIIRACTTAPNSGAGCVAGRNRGLAHPPQLRFVRTLGSSGSKDVSAHQKPGLSGGSSRQGRCVANCRRSPMC